MWLTFNLAPISLASTPLLLNENADVRAATFRSSTFDRAFSSSSARPSQKCSLSGSALMFVNGKTAIECRFRDLPGAESTLVDPARRSALFWSSDSCLNALRSRSKSFAER